MRQNIPKASKDLKTFGVITARGLNLFEKSVGVKQNVESTVRHDTQALVNAEDESQAAQTARKEANAEVRASDQEVKTFICITRELLKPVLGNTYSIPWKEVGFVNNSLGVPRLMDSRVSQVKSIQMFLERHPELVKPGVLTPELAFAIHDRAVTALAARNIATADMREKTKLRDAAKLALQRRLRALFQELRYLLPANDARWLDFGFNVPGDVSVPAAPENVTATSESAGKVSVSWETPVHTEHSRVFCKVIGQDEEFEAKASTRDTKITLTGLPSGAQLQLYVTAVNRAGESVASQIVEVGVP